MANVYVRSGAAGAGTGADWANAYTTLAAAFTAKAAGDSFWVSEDHAETQASAMTLTSPGTTASPCLVYCVNHAGSVPPVSADLATTATVTTTIGSAVNITGVSYYYGIIFSAGSGANTVSISLPSSATGTYNRFDSCALRLGGTSGGKINLGTAANGAVDLINTTIQVASTSAGITPSLTYLGWKNTASAITGATIPTSLFSFASFAAGTVFLDGVDLSAMGAGKTIVNSNAASNVQVVLKDCKLGSSVTVSPTPGSPTQPTTDLIRCDSGATNYRTERYRYAGTQTVETTIVRTGGASDGTTSIAWKLVTTANSKWVLPFEALPIAIWNDSTSSVTVTVYGIWGGGAVPNNDDIWMDVEYLGAAGNPQGSFATTTKADNLATNAALTSDSSTWGGSTTKFKMTATFTPAQKGAIYIYIKAAAASSTFYIDPKPVLS